MYGSVAYWISPGGHIAPVDVSHVNSVLRHPAKFGMRPREVEQYYRRHGEKLGLEGNARQQIIRRLVARGWVRIRRYPNRYWSINVHELTGEVRALLREWASAMLADGVAGCKENDGHMPVRIARLGGGPVGAEHTMLAIASGSLGCHDRRCMELVVHDSLRGIPDSVRSPRR